MATRTEFVPGKPSPAQADLMCQALVDAYAAGWKGRFRENTAPRIARWVPRPTKVSMRSKGLLEMVGSKRDAHLLTKEAIVVVEQLYKERTGQWAELVAEERRQRKQKEDQARQDRVDRAKHLFRGLSIKRGFRGASTKRSRMMVTHIDHGGEVRLRLEDLLELGEQIEKLR